MQKKCFFKKNGRSRVPTATGQLSLLRMLSTFVTHYSLAQTEISRCRSKISWYSNSPEAAIYTRVAPGRATILSEALDLQAGGQHSNIPGK
jgi:hypothetical protein